MQLTKRTFGFIALAGLAGLLLGYLIFGSVARDSGAAEVHEHVAGEEGELWTCSMHPQILQPEPGSCPICGMDLIPVEKEGGALAPGQFRLSANALALADVRTVRVGAGSEAPAALTLSGTVEANEKTIATQSAYFAGRVERLSVNFEGESVNRGQRLATLYAPELVAAQQELLTAVSLKESRPALYQAVRKKLELWKLSEAQIREIEQSGQVREYFPITSDVTGTVTEISTAAGDYVQKGAPLFRIADLRTVWIVFDAYEDQLPFLQEGQLIRVRAKALPGKELEARIGFIDPLLNTGTRTVAVRAEVDNRDGALKPGMFVSGTLDASNPGNSDEALLIPQSAVLWTGERSVVYVKPDPAQPVFEMRQVSLGRQSEAGYEVISGLRAGDEIVAQGAFTVDAAAQLQGAKSMMNPAGGPTSTGHEGHGAMPEMQGSEPQTLSEQGRQAVTASLAGYLQVKDALVASDAAATREAAQKSANSLATYSGSDHAIHMLRDAAAEMASASTLEALRAGFKNWSTLLIDLGAPKGYGNTLYVQFCPMADGYNGASWISRQEEIRNPYFGDAMLTCGEVTQTWSALP